MMPSLYSTPHHIIGWDVVGWNCDRNRASRDALVILDEHGVLELFPQKKTNGSEHPAIKSL